MNTEPTTSASPSGPADEGVPLYWRDLQVRADRAEVTRRDVARQDRELARSTDGFTSDCLAPDDAELLLESGYVEVIGTDVRVVEQQDIPLAQQSAVAHLDGCSFCKAMLSAMQPSVSDRTRFLAAVRTQTVPSGRRSVALEYVSALAPGFVLFVGIVYWYFSPTVSVATLLYCSPILVIGLLAAVAIIYLQRHQGGRFGWLGRVAAAIQPRFAAPALVLIALWFNINGGLALQTRIRDSQVFAAETLSPMLVQSSTDARGTDGIEHMVDVKAATTAAATRLKFSKLDDGTLAFMQDDVPGIIKVAVHPNMTQINWKFLGREVEGYDLRVIGRHERIATAAYQDSTAASLRDPSLLLYSAGDKDVLLHDVWGNRELRSEARLAAKEAITKMTGAASPVISGNGAISVAPEGAVRAQETPVQGNGNAK